MENVKVNYCWFDENGDIHPVHARDLCAPKQSYANMNITGSEATIDVNGKTIVLPFDMIEMIYSEMKLKRAEK